MKVIGIVGYKKSGKTTFIIKLADYLIKKGYEVSIVKSIHGDMDERNTDTGRFFKVSKNVAAITSKDASIFLKNVKDFDKVLSFIGGDIVLAEGFKERRDYPRILLFREKGEIEHLANGLEIAYASLGDYRGNKKPFFPISEIDEYIPQIGDLVLKHAFKLPGIDCGSCGFPTCYEMAKKIITGNAKPEDCVINSAKKEVVLKVDGKTVPLMPFVEDLVKNMTLETLSTLKGVDGKVFNLTIKKS